MLASPDTVKPRHYYFTAPTTVRETSIENMLKKIYKHDFVEPESQYSVNNKINLNYDNLPKNYRRFLELLKREAVKIDGHNQFPLPLKDKELVLPNNRMAARKCDCAVPEGRTWYVPHQGVLNPNKGRMY